MTRRIGRPLASIVAALSAGAAFAQAPLPQAQTRGAITYLSGGAGDEEVQSIRQSMKDYSVALAFARTGSPRAEYVANVAVIVRDARGATVFEAPSVGPYLLLKLPAGTYAVAATYQDRTQTRSVAAGKAAASLVTLEW